MPRPPHLWSPRDATVYVDGKKIGKLPRPKRLDVWPPRLNWLNVCVEPGKHVMELVYRGRRKRVERRVEGGSGARVQVEFDVPRDAGGSRTSR